jgi:hypothetical protein
LTFLKSFRLGDGNINKHNSISYFTTSKLLADDIQEMLIKLNISGKITKDSTTGTITYFGKRKMIRKNDVYKIYQKQKQTNKSLLKKNNKRIDYDGFVFCVSVDNKIIRVRRKGVSMWSGNSDTNTLCVIDGNVPIDLDEWQTDDPNVSARKAFYKALEVGADEIRYDCIGVGAGIKAGFNNILEELNKRQLELEVLIQKTYNDDEKQVLQKQFTKNDKALKIKIIGWAASSGVIRPNECDYGDKQDNDKTNGELFENAKSQAYFKIRNEFLQTFYHGNKERHTAEKLICFKHIQEHRLFNKFVNEISQPIQKLSARGKILIDKKGSGKSPNLAEGWLIGRAEIELHLSVWDV